ncbi:protein phosphatase CheZ [Pseudoteredinibacter isoporae]|uniref:Protein phosphatase CheZ n=1 Tax=Pseudoteredinibacter isoporae TaxID=570281 RepID=A0A7X0JWD4_9GAMM|nr:protein phosphatase CheZ [Pseudoteredinibacter isoporae]MBB6523453.1 chemotaxis protein CheZ [Pseudoteredinibacter isoporae]NHO88962.1 protein phosphatase CheZ [Pseudoteredinibacter isoporae]NIB24330.1 protein phosphatase CheZ [Pseudoteredinibacter isoporae]
MNTQYIAGQSDNFITELRECAKLLVEKLESEQIEEAGQLIHALMDARDRHLFTSIGRLTRGLHNAIVNFHVDEQSNHQPAPLEGTEIQDASDRLHYVIKMTQQAADKTMDRVEATAPVADRLGREAAELRSEWMRIKSREMSAQEFNKLYPRMDMFLNRMSDDANLINSNLQGIMMEQEYQDLTGQVLNRVMALISDLEGDLVELIKVASQVEDITGILPDDNGPAAVEAKQAEALSGPQINPEQTEGAVSSQDEVDDLLSSLGF